MSLSRHKLSVLLLSTALMLVCAPSVGALIVPFTEEFSANASGWLTGASQSPTWNATGGADGGAYISTTATMTPTGFGAALFRGNATSDASGDAFVGNWLSGGVTLFTAFLKHDSPQALDLFVRLDAGAGAAASSVFFSVPSNQWFQMSVPIVNSPTSFQSFGAAGPSGFSTVFANIQNVQFFASPNSPAGTFRFDLDKVSTVPEPGTIGLVALSAIVLLSISLRRRKLDLLKR
jgi:hypothetical protein